MTQTVVHKWSRCEFCGPMVLCGHCGNNCCNGGTKDDCPDKCASAYAEQDKGLTRMNARIAHPAAPLPSGAGEEWRVGSEDDEIVFGDFHMERMNDGHIWFVVGGEAFDLFAEKKGNLTWRVQSSAGWSGIAKTFAETASLNPLPVVREEDVEWVRACSHGRGEFPTRAEFGRILSILESLATRQRGDK